MVRVARAIVGDTGEESGEETGGEKGRYEGDMGDVGDTVGEKAMGDIGEWMSISSTFGVRLLWGMTVDNVVVGGIEVIDWMVFQ